VVFEKTKWNALEKDEGGWMKDEEVVDQNVIRTTEY
jgi:hypothetical protein